MICHIAVLCSQRRQTALTSPFPLSEKFCAAKSAQQLADRHKHSQKKKLYQRLFRGFSR
jgi:hypothetical protein